MTDASRDGAASGVDEGVSLSALALSVLRVHIVAVAVMACAGFGWIFSGERAWAVAGICAVDWFVVNLVNRVTDIDEDRANQVVDADALARQRRLWIGVAIGALVVSLPAGHLIEPRLWPLRVAFHALGLAYNFPILGSLGRVKSWFFLKNVASATGFLLTVIGYPLAVATAPERASELMLSWEGIALVALFFFAFEISYEIIYDFRDIRGDRLVGARTLPTVLGESRSGRITALLIAASSLPLLGGFAFGVLPWHVVVLATGPLVQLALFWRAYRAERIDSRFCIRLTWLGAGLFGAYHLWPVIGLPGTPE